MPQIDILNKENKPIGTADLPQEIFGAEVRKGLLHAVVRNHLANKRQGTSATKTRGLVSGGGKKPHKQKGSGRARAGSNRSPIWRGGGTVFGPQPRDYSYKLPKKVKWAAFNSALSSRFSDGAVIVIDDLSISEPKTKLLTELLKGFGLKENVLIILPEKNRDVELAARNLPRVNIARVSELNVYTILAHEKLLIVKEAVGRMKEVYLG
jgi:large subunit ribosomal protein L4